MTASKIVAAAASGVGGAGLDVDEVFAMRMWEGTSNNETITNDIDLTGEGGLVWTKKYTGSANNVLIDTVRGATKMIRSNGDSSEATEGNTVTGFNNNGFTISNDDMVNAQGSGYMNYTFRKAEKFFDIVQYTGNGSNRTINHNLGSAPGMMLFKKTSGAQNWVVYHIGSNGGNSPEDYYFRLNQDIAQVNDTNQFQSTAPTSTQFFLGNDYDTNENGQTYICYLFAHNDDDGGFGPNGDADIIKCGRYIGNTSSGSEPVINLGFEPQWVLFKNTDSASDWFIYNTQLGWRVALSPDLSLAANSSTAFNGSSGSAQAGFPTSTGFDLKGCSMTAVNKTNDNHIYVAIRRGSLNVPENANKVFGLDTDATGGSSVVNFRPHLCDMAWFAKLGGHNRNVQVADRLRGFEVTDANSDDSYSTPTLSTNNENSEETSGNAIHQVQTYGNAPVVRAVSSGSNFCLWGFKRAPSFFDIVCWDGNSSARTISHNLGVAPEMMWVKSRTNNSHAWNVYHSATGATHYNQLNATANPIAATNIWNDTAPTSSVFSLADGAPVNESSKSYVGFLFASAAGVSKVGTYTGNGSSSGDTQTIDCGFTSGARLIMIKNVVDTGDWALFDTARGITASKAERLRLNTNDAQVPNGSPTQTYHDLIDAHNSGFIVNYDASLDVNSNGKKYIFWAIA